MRFAGGIRLPQYSSGVFERWHQGGVANCGAVGGREVACLRACFAAGWLNSSIEPFVLCCSMVSFKTSCYYCRSPFAASSTGLLGLRSYVRGA